MKLTLKNTILCTSFIALLNVNEAKAYPLYQTNYNQFVSAVKRNDYMGVRKHFRPMFVNAKDGSGQTPLSLALKNENYEISNFLMNNGANPYITNSEGYPAYCDSKNNGNSKIQSRFKGYDYGQCPADEALFDKKAAVYTVGFAAVVGGIAAAAGSSGGGSSSNNNGGGNGEEPTVDSKYSMVGEVDQAALDDVINSDDYKGVFTTGSGQTFSNAPHFDMIRLPYSIARGYTGKYTSDYPKSPEFINDDITNPGDVPTNAGDKVRVAVVDTGVQLNNINISDNIIETSVVDSNLAYAFCQDNPTDSKCTSATYTDDANPNATYTNENATWHGTAVANLIAGKYGNNDGIMGVAPDAEILPYRITFDDGKFVNQEYIARAFKSAADNNAVVINNSWGVPTLDEDENHTVDASDITKAQLEALYGDMIDEMKKAVTDKDVTFVFAAGNDGTAQSGLESAIPLHFEEFQKDGAYINFINVVAYDTTTGSLADYSNKCGVTKNYCLTAPGTDMVSSIYESGNLSSEANVVVEGTSFAAPLVSGAYAVLKGAFPYLTGADITKLLFVSARDLGDEGVDEVYGWGMLDLERATRPFGATLVPVDKNIDDTNYTLASTSLKVSPLLANKIQSQNLKAVYLDSFKRTFEFDLNDKIEIVSDRPELNDMFDRFATSKLRPIEFANNQDLQFYSATHKISRNTSLAREFKVSYNNKNTTNGKYGFSFYFGNNPYNSFMDNDVEFYNNYALSTTSNKNILNPYFRNDSNENYGFNNRFFINEKTSFNLGFLYQNYTPNTQKNDYAGIKQEDFGESMSVISSLSYSPTEKITTTAEFGLLNEKNTLFASRTSGAFGLGNNNKTYYFGLQNDLNVTSDFSLIGRANVGYTKVNRANNSLIENVSDLYTNSFAAGFNYNILNDKERKSNISFIVAQSLRINAGSMDIRLPKARDDAGNLTYQNYNIDLADKANLEYQLSYNYQTADESEFNAGVIFSSFTENTKKVNEGIFMMNYNKAF